MRRLLGFFKRYRWGILSGILVGTSYIPFPPWALAFCWVPLWWDLVQNSKSWKESFAKAWWAQFLLTLIGFHWISYVAHEFGFLPWYVAIPILLAYAALVHTYIPLAATLTWFLKEKFKLPLLSQLLLLASFHSLGEIFWPSVFEWNLGYPLFWANSPWAQWADTFGFLGLSFLVHLVNSLITYASVALVAKPELKEPALKKLALPVLAIVIVLGAAHWFGKEKQKSWDRADSKITALLVQANIGNLEKVYAEKGMGYQREIIERYLGLTEKHLSENSQIDLVVWPESAIPEFLDDHNRERKYATVFFESLRRLNKPVFTGAYSNDPPDKRPREDYNSVFLFDTTGKAQDPAYHKTNLLMFGEYVPFGDLFPILRKWNPAGSGFGRGSGPTTLRFGDYLIGPQICYESLDPRFSAAMARNGAHLLINVTNDSWFGPRSEPEQHMIMTLARAVETRRPLLRSTNTGITTAVTAAGRLYERSPKSESWAGAFEIPVRKNPEITLYTEYGYLLPVFIFALILFLIAKGIRRGTS